MGHAGKGRLNFVIPDATDTRLEAYCERTGRDHADVIRQLVSEWIEGDRHLPKPATEHPTGRRTNIPLGYATLAALDERIRAEKHATASAAISALLDQFLANRVPNATEELVPVRVQLPVSDYTVLSAHCGKTGTTIAELLAKDAAGHANDVRSVTTKIRNSKTKREA